MNATTDCSSGGRVPMRLLVVAVSMMLLATTILPRGAAAEPVNPRQAMQTQKAVCEALGGAASTEQQQLAGTGIDVATKVTCSGGLLDGMTCTNALVNDSSKCSMSRTEPDDGIVWRPIVGEIPELAPVGFLPPSQWSTVDVTAVLAGLEAGLTPQEILPGLQAPPSGGPDMTPPHDGPSDPHLDTGKKRGHGKKHGKGRKR